MIVLFGAGDCGRCIARNLEDVFIFADNDPAKHGTLMMNVPVLSPDAALAAYPDARWIASIGKPGREEVIAQLERMGIVAEMPWKYLDTQMGLPPDHIRNSLFGTLYDSESKIEFNDQCAFRRSRDYDFQLPPSSILDIYFPDFIIKRDDEHFVDCGAADGDTVKEFLKRWERWSFITAFEPDKANYAKLREASGQWIEARWCAVSDERGMMPFHATADYSSHLSKHASQPATTMVECVKLDDSLRSLPTFIKMDIEGSELEALWGARNILKAHSPVLAICAYHLSDHLWQIPLLIHAIQPNYKLFLRRYSPGTFDLVWYAVPPERVQ